jgi:tRNA threonylcarbamoyl adenosine modification protein YeaZ
MLILILETSCEKSCLVLAEIDTPISFTLLPGGPSLSRSLALEVKNLLGSRKPDLVAVGAGPGSYTGIRVGAALAKALAYGWNVPLMGFCSLKAFGPAPVLLDARSGGFYALIGDQAELIATTDPRLEGLAEIRSPHPDLIKKRLGSGPILHESSPDPARLAKVVWGQFSEGGIAPLELNYCSCP